LVAAVNMALKPAPMWLNPTNRAATLHPKVTRIRVTPAISPEETLNRVLGAGPKRSVLDVASRVSAERRSFRKEAKEGAT